MRRVLLGLFGAFVAGIVTWCTAAADIVKLNTGGKVVGKIVEEDESRLVVETLSGRTIIRREDVLSVERGADVVNLYRKRLEQVNPSSARDHYELGLWCKENKLAEEYEKHMLEAIRLAPDFAPPHEELGYVFYKGKWLEYEAACEARGWKKFEGVYYPPETAARLEQGLVELDGGWVSKKTIEKERNERLGKIHKYEKSAETVKLGEIKVPEDIRQLLEMAQDADAARRLAAYEALHSKDKLARELLANILFHERAQSRSKLLAYFKSNKSSIRSRLIPLVEERRARALDIILDKTIYPDANHGRSGQPKVDEAVNALRLVYETPFEYYLGTSAAVQAAWERHKEVAALVNRFTDARIDLREEQKEISEEVADIISMWQAMAPEGAFEILEYNRKAHSSLTAEERACVDQTNRYRMMFGRLPLRVHEGLVQAARKHSQCMEKNKFFSHDCPTHGSPASRCRAEGAPYRSENIAMGTASGVWAFWLWYNSSGHHRNMLGPHAFIGVGNSARYWTQDFG